MALATQVFEVAENEVVERTAAVFDYRFVVLDALFIKVVEAYRAFLARLASGMPDFQSSPLSPVQIRHAQERKALPSRALALPPPQTRDGQ
jgi:hypothetical protein